MSRAMKKFGPRALKAKIDKKVGIKDPLAKAVDKAVDGEPKKPAPAPEPEPKTSTVLEQKKKDDEDEKKKTAKSTLLGS